VAGQHDLLAGLVGLELEGPGAHRVGLEPVLAFALDRLLGHDVAAGVVGELGQEERVRDGLVDRDLHRERVDLLEADAGEVAGVGGGVFIGRTLERKNDVVRGELVAGVAREGVEEDPLAQLEGPDLLVHGHRPGFGDVRLQLDLVAGRVAH
jgi:hypothetical protein